MADLVVSPQFENRTWKYWTEPNFVTVNGIETAYRRKGSGPVLVYLHGGSATRSWLPFLEKLSQHFDVIAPEIPGYGDTLRPAHIDSWDDYLIHMASFFNELGLKEFHLVGNSLGGWIAANLAVHYPGLFESVTLITPAGVKDPGTPLIDLFRMTPEEEAEAAFNGRIESYLDQLEQWGEPEDSIVAYLESVPAALLMWNPRYDVKLPERLGHLSTPLLVVGVELDQLVGTGSAKRYAELAAHGELVTISGGSLGKSSHMVFMEQPDEVVSEITNFVTRIEKEKA